MGITRLGAQALNTNSADGAPPELPPELHGTIIELATQSCQLASLCLVSKVFQYTAERLLYASVGKTRTKGPRRYHTLFLTTINANARLAALVREYQILSIVERNKFPLWYLLKSGLKKMTNLKHFDYREMNRQSSGKLLRNVSFKLDTLVWDCDEDEKHIKKILYRGQNGLKSLFYYDCKPGTSFHSKACPNLKTLCGSRVVIEALLPGRHVEEVSITVWKNEDTGHVEGLQEALSRVRKLTIGGYFRRPSVDVFSHHLSSIEVLGISSHALHRKELEAIQCLKTLRVLIVPVNWNGTDGIITSLFNELPLLGSVYTQLGSKVGHRRLYNQWGRNTSDATGPLKLGVVEEVLNDFFTFHY